MESNVHVGKYVIRFGIVNLLLLVAIAVVLTLLGVDGNSGTSVAALIGAALAAGNRFLKDHKRLPNPSEKRRLTWLSLLAAVVVSLCLLVAFLLWSGATRELLSMLPPGTYTAAVVLGVLAFVTALHFLALSFSYGFLLKRQYEGMIKKGVL